MEDNRADRLLLQSAFQEAGVRCHWHVIQSGSEAVRIAESTIEGFQPVLILLDWQLPGVTGLEVLAKLKYSEVWASTPVLMLTGVRSPLQVKSAREAGACEVLEKPIDIDQWLRLPAQIENALASAA